MQRRTLALHCATLFLAPAALADPLASTPVAVTGMVAPGGGGTFTTMDYTFGIRGNTVGLRASTTGSFPADDGDWISSGAGLQLSVFNNQIPVNQPGVQVFGPGRVAVDPAGDVAFVDLGTGLSVVRNGVLTNVANGNMFEPGSTTTKFGLFGQPAINAAGGVAFQSGNGLWTDAYGNGLQSVALVGQPAPGGGTYSSINDSARIAGTTIVNTASVAIPAGTGTATTTVSGIFSHTPTSDQLIARVGDPVPALPGYTYFINGTPFTNNVGHVAFKSALTSSSGPGITAILTQTALGLQVAATTGQAAPGIAGTTFFSVNDPVSNDHDAVAFTADAIDSKAHGTNGIWSSAQGSLALVASQGQAAPDLPAGVTFNGNFADLALGNTGAAGFIATLTDANSTLSNDKALYGQDATGALHLVAYTGESMIPAPGQAPGVISAIQFADAFWTPLDQNMSDNEIVYRLTFTDGRQGIYTTVVPEPATIALVGCGVLLLGNRRRGGRNPG